jgi:predicted MFS family arabinose efflux permease
MMLPYRRPTRQPKIDYVGAVVLAATITCLVAFADSRQIFGSLVAPASLALLIGGIVGAGLWVFVESRVPEPIVPLKLFRDSTFSLYLIISLCAGSVGIGLVNYYALFLQTTTGLSPSAAGLFFIALTGGIVAGSISAGRLISVTGRYKPFTVVGLAMSCVMLFCFSRIGHDVSLTVVAVIMFLQGLSVGFGQQAPIIGVQNAVPRGDVGAASGAVALMRMGGASIAISLFGAIVGTGLKASSTPIPGLADIETLTPKILAGLPEASRQAVAAVYHDAFSPLFLTAAAIAAIGLVAALCLKPIQLPSMKAAAAPKEEKKAAA